MKAKKKPVKLETAADVVRFIQQARENIREFEQTGDQHSRQSAAEQGRVLDSLLFLLTVVHEVEV